MIYFLRHVETGLIKIGKADYFDNRLKQLEFKYGKFETLGFLEGNEDVEKPLHQVFAPFQNTELLEGVEFFDPHPSLISYIDAVGLDELPDYGRIAIDFPNIPQKGDDYIFVCRIGEFFEVVKEQLNFSNSKIAGLIGYDPATVGRLMKLGRKQKRLDLKVIGAIYNAFDIPYWALYSEVATENNQQGYTVWNDALNHTSNRS